MMGQRRKKASSQDAYYFCIQETAALLCSMRIYESRLVGEMALPRSFLLLLFQHRKQMLPQTGAGSLYLLCRPGHEPLAGFKS